MKIFIFVSLFISLSLLISAFLPIRAIHKRRKAILYTATIFYGFFFLLAFLAGGSDQGEDSQVINSIDNVNISIDKKDEQEKDIEDNQEKNQTESPIDLKWEIEAEVVENEAFSLKLTVSNNSEQDWGELKLEFPTSPLRDSFSISTIRPAVNPQRSTIGLGGIKAEETKEFIFELVPREEGTYEEEIILLVDGEPILTGTGELTSNLEIVVNGKN